MGREDGLVSRPAICLGLPAVVLSNRDIYARCKTLCTKTCGLIKKCMCLLSPDKDRCYMCLLSIDGERDRTLLTRINKVIKLYFKCHAKQVYF